MSFHRLEVKRVASVRRISRWHASRSSPVVSEPSGPSASTSPVRSKASLVTRNAVSCAIGPLRCDLAMRGEPLEFVPKVCADQGLPAPRRDLVTRELSQEDKLKCARRLVDYAINILASAWTVVETGPFPVLSTAPGDGVSTSMDVNSSHGAAPPHLPYDGWHYPYQSTSEHMPLRQFVHEVLRRSCTHFSTLQTALRYVETAAARLPILVKQEADLMLMRAQPGYVPRTNVESSEVAALPSPLLCPRRTFVASILLAAKFLQDRSYANRSWAKLTGLSAIEVSRCERALCVALDYRLWPDRDSGPVPAINGLDTMPVIDINMSYQPEPTPVSSAAAVGVPTPHTVEQVQLPSFETLLASLPAVAIDESVANPPVRSPPVLAHALSARQPLCSQPRGAYPDSVSSILSPSLSNTRSSPAGSVSSFDVSTPDDISAGPQGHKDKGC